MGRRRLYNTKEELRDAARRSREKYYLKNRDQINQRLKHQYSESRERYVYSSLVVPLRVNMVNYSLHAQESIATTLATTETSQAVLKTRNPSPHKCAQTSESRSNIAKRSTTKSAENMLRDFLGSSFASFFETLYQNLTDSLTPKDPARNLSTLLETAGHIQTYSRSQEADVLQKQGVGAALRSAQLTTRKVSTVIGGLEDMYVHVVMDIVELKQKHAACSLSFVY
ncbi:hypothetical protein HYDPIDRAFT_39649 [Hydnomerulius pinastri MD-312]|uniref:Uncharacterized protein n=1 Tax=Hydnomerulius pinastri MD-312 TaxID=994086 RepID=A0A0C9VH87_9AGAM|nr:hypothetical protein HYDPIDRAFT_39649 [Hydnomerulius pinastri MD-312]